MPTPLYPPLWRRFAAMVYDSLPLFAISMGYGAVYIAVAKYIFQATTDTATGALFQLGWALVLVGFFCYFWHRGGQTIGMRAWRLQLVQQGTIKFVSYRQCLLRCLFATLSLLLFGIGYWWSFFDKNRQTLQDRLTKTEVIMLPKPK